MKASAPDQGPSSTTASVPKDAIKAFDKARTEWLDQKPDKAQKDLEKAVQTYPQFAEAWFELGKIQEKSKPQDATNSFTKAVLRGSGSPRRS